MCLSVSWMYCVNAADTHETFHQESGMRYHAHTTISSGDPGSETAISCGSAPLGVDCPQDHRCCDFRNFGAQKWASLTPGGSMLGSILTFEPAESGEGDREEAQFPKRKRTTGPVTAALFVLGAIR